MGNTTVYTTTTLRGCSAIAYTIHYRGTHETDDILDFLSELMIISNWCYLLIFAKMKIEINKYFLRKKKFFLIETLMISLMIIFQLVFLGDFCKYENWKKLKHWCRFQGYLCESGMTIYRWRVASNYTCQFLPSDYCKWKYYINCPLKLKSQYLRILQNWRKGLISQ